MAMIQQGKKEKLYYLIDHHDKGREGHGWEALIIMTCDTRGKGRLLMGAMVDLNLGVQPHPQCCIICWEIVHTQK